MIERRKKRKKEKTLSVFMTKINWGKIALHQFSLETKHCPLLRSKKVGMQTNHLMLYSNKPAGQQYGKSKRQKKLK